MGSPMNYCGYIKESINEGEGLRSVIFFSGCPFKCKGCHNPNTQKYDYGEEFSLNTQLNIIADIKSNQLLKGITLCGGEPFANKNWKDVLSFVKLLKQEIPNINIWSYTGYTIEELLELPQIELLNEIDVLIDGQFVEELKDLTLKFRGSSNQRIIYLK